MDGAVAVVVLFSGAIFAALYLGAALALELLSEAA
jgi:hypothetical protein